MAVLEKALCGQWTESMANAWTELWQVRHVGPAKASHTRGTLCTRPHRGSRPTRARTTFFAGAKLKRHHPPLLLLPLTYVPE